MLKSIRNKLAALVAVMSLVAVPLAVPMAAFADTPNISDNLCTGAALTTTSQTCSGTTSSGTTKINGIITTVVNIFSIIVGVVAVIMIIIGGLRYITSGGDSNNVSAAKNTIIYAIIGLVVVALAQFIVQFVLNKVTS